MCIGPWYAQSDDEKKCWDKLKEKKAKTALWLGCTALSNKYSPSLSI